MGRVFVFEYLTAGGLEQEDAAAAATLLPMGVAMRDAMVNDLLQAGGVQVSAATCASTTAPPAGAQACMPPPGTPFVEWVAWQAARHDAVWLVAPETDGLLASLQQAVPAARWLGCDAPAITLAGRKRATLARLAAFGLKTPLAFATTAARWVVKPDDGAGTLDTRVHRERGAAEADLAARRARGASATLEPWVEGEALSLSMLAREGGVELLSINRQHIEIGADGAVAYRGVAINQLGGGLVRAGALCSTARAVGRAVRGLRGFVGVDLVWHADHGPVVIEVNPRPTCAYVGLSAALDRNLAAETLAAHAEAQHVAA